jgi:GTP cyclohydrolase I
VTRMVVVKDTESLGRRGHNLLPFLGKVQASYWQRSSSGWKGLHS